MKILIHCIHYPVCSGHYMADAFRRVGHDVRHVGNETGRRIWGLELPAGSEWHQEPPESGWTPDLCVLMDTAYQWHHPTVPTVMFTVDNHVRQVRQGGIVHYFLAHKNASITEWGDDCTWLPCGFAPDIFTPSTIPFDQREYDVACVGVMYDRRWEVVSAMRTAGLKVFAGMGLTPQNMAKVYQNARLSLCVSARGDVGQRIFETVACGCFILTDPLADFSPPLVLPDGRELHPLLLDGIFTQYTNPEEAVGIAKDLLGNYKGAAISGIKAMQARLKYHTWDARAIKILAWYKQEYGDAGTLAEAVS